MAKDTKPQRDQTTGFDPTFQTEKIAFDPDELAPCGGCGRMNPPNRLKCLYCARELDTKLKVGGSGRVAMRRLELWEKGFNLITRDQSDNFDIQKMARLLSTEPEDLSPTLEAGTPLPVARVETEKEASFLQEALGNLGLNCSIVRDVDLAADGLPRRLRDLQLSDNEIVFVDFNTGDVTTVPAGELAVIVVGTLTTGRVDSTEKRGRGGKRKLLDETAISTDEPVLDIYTRGDPAGFRINHSGFDFSCLGEDKRLLAGENMRQLADRLKQFAAQVEVVNYSSIRHLLGRTWELESKTEPQGMQHSGLRRTGYGSAQTTNNLDQFTKFSRLQWQLYGKK